MSVPAGTLGDMTEPIPPSGERDLSRALAVRSDEQLLERVSALIEQTRTLVARQTNVALTLLYWEIGRLIDVEVLKQERADYARRIVGSLAPQLTARFGRGFDQSNLHRMIKLSQVELLEMHKDGIVVAEYWTDLPPKAELEVRIQAIYRAAAERVARRELPLASDD